MIKTPDTQLDLLVRLQFKRSGEWGVFPLFPGGMKPRDEMTNVLNYNTFVSKFKLELGYYVHLQTNPIILPPAMGKY